VCISFYSIPRLLVGWWGLGLGGSSGRVKEKRSNFGHFIQMFRRLDADSWSSCSQAANAAGKDGGTTVNDCDKQNDECKSAQSSASVQDFTTGVASTNIGPDPAFPDFDLICDA
jgi:CxxC motif-containing protein (DUF1111 family)